MKATAAQDAAAIAQQAPAADQAVESTGATAVDGSMPGCGGPEHGCCGSCQEKVHQAQPAEKPMAGCPCQRARQARERARQEQTGS